MSSIQAPDQPLPRRYLQSILFLADRMSQADGNDAPKQRRMVDVLAEAAEMKDFRREKSYRQLSDRRACEKLDIEEAKKAALLAVTLVMKAESVKGEEERQYFRKIRDLLDCDPITVPTELLYHKELALKFLG